ncbi:MAG: SIMPL domain-containing protein [Chloroflexi bacterium]|nr:SIMPL domain-containing protein [Chloroflexota bacterium]
MNRKVQSRSLLLLAALALALAAGCAPAGDRPFDHTLNVTGEGSAQVPPDLAVASIGVHVQKAEAGAAVEENNRRSNAVAAAIKGLGVADADLQTLNFSIFARDQYDRDGSPTGEVLYVTDNTVTVTVRDLSKLGAVLDAAVQAGANSIFGVSYAVEDQSAAAAQAREKALADARARAEQLAAGAGVTLGRVLNAGESLMGGPVYSPFTGGKAADYSGVPTAAGNLSVQVQVYVTYEIK